MGRGIRLTIVLSFCLLAGLVAVGSVSAEADRVHVVGWGDNLTRIARQYGVTVSNIVQENRLSNPNLIWIGQRLRIPDAPEVATLSGADSATRSLGNEQPPLVEAAPKPESASRPAAGDTQADPVVEAETSASISGVVAAGQDGASENLEAPPQAESGPTEDQADGQVEVVPQTAAPGDEPEPEPVVHVVVAGENLSRIGARYGISATAIARFNDINNPNLVYVGQKLRIPGGEDAARLSSPLPAALPTARPAQAQSISGKWIEINLSTSRVVAWQGASPVRSLLASLGMPWTPTPPGRFSILSKFVSTPMSGPGYYLPGVPHTMYFYRGYAIHGAYWHNNFGHPMSHGCVNLSLPDAAWLFGWTPMGTPVIVHW